MENLTIQQAIKMAEDTAASKHIHGLLCVGDADLSTKDWSRGDPETIYTIAAMYAQFVPDYDMAEDDIVYALTDLYPDYI